MINEQKLKVGAKENQQIARSLKILACQHFNWQMNRWEKLGTCGLS